VNVIGFDDGPFSSGHRGDVLLVGVICAGTRLDGVVSGKIRRDGANATERMVELVRTSQFAHVRAVLLQGIAVGGFNVVDVHALSAELGVPVLVVMRKPPDLASIERALFSGNPPRRPRVQGASRKWNLIRSAGPIEALPTSASRRPSGLREASQKLWVQRAGLSLETATRVVASTTLHGHVPEPLRLAHLIAGGIARGKSRGRT
jgi:endonuclease V-like protein UPF0215 family